jgi:serpin B
MSLDVRKLLIAGAAVLAAACSSSSEPLGRPLTDLDPAEKLVSSSGNDFSFALFQQLARSEAGKNVVVSPLSASMSLGMTLNGAAGPTFDAMRSAMRLGSGDVAQINAGYRKLIDALHGVDQATTFQVANSIWYRNTFPFRQSFLDTTKKYFDAEVKGLDFADRSASLSTINNWVSSKTNGRIPTIIDDVTPDEVMFLINAVYFKGAWQVQFDPKSTSNGTFLAADGTQQSVPFMHRPMYREPRFSSGGSQTGLSITEVPYGNGSFVMDFIMGPVTNPRASIDSIAGMLTPTVWDGLLSSLREVDYALAIPKFTATYERVLNNDLSTLGMGVAFTPAADFSNTSSAGLQIEFVKQKTFIQVDETGTEAGASTITGVIPTSLSEVEINRPFIFAIREKGSGTILFVGKILRIP